MTTISPNPTIAAIATPFGRGGIGIVRISGSLVPEIAQKILGSLPKPRYATHTDFLDSSGNALDQGIALYFPAPNSFTGEDVLELQGHGGPVILDLLMQHILQLGGQIAKPGEFSERAFLNDKIDLVQAEAIADLIDSASQQAARSALQSLQGEFSKKINSLFENLVHLRMYVEAAIDFPEEEIDFLSDGHVAKSLKELISQLTTLQQHTRQGVLLREGMTAVIAGSPNAGKSSLLNCLSGEETAIVSNIPGTTRDVLREFIQIDGMPIQIIDTAGLRNDSNDCVEQEGMRRARNEIDKADRILFIIDVTDIKDFEKNSEHAEIFANYANKITVIHNKIDLTVAQPEIKQNGNNVSIKLSAKTGAGLELLREHLKTCMGFSTPAGGQCIARRRHLDALEKTLDCLVQGQAVLERYKAGELVAEHLLQAQNTLAEITGKFRSDDLLGKIFSSFCIGK